VNSFKKYILFFFIVLLSVVFFDDFFFGLLTRARDITYQPKHFYSLAQAPNHQAWDSLLHKYVSSQGLVNYQGFIKDSVVLHDYLRLLSSNPPNDSLWTKNERLAYWINAYNAFTISLVIRHWGIQSIQEIGKGIGTPWNIPFITIGKEKLSLEDIEHRILRFMNEPRIHFAINCASISCPKLLNKAYQTQNIELQLKEQTIAFLSDTSRNKITEEEVALSRIFQWFKADFEKKQTLYEFILEYYPISHLKEHHYLPYDWSLNQETYQ